MSGAAGARRGGLLRAIAAAWLIAGTFDIVVACVYYPLTTGISVTRLLQGIASGLLGTAAFSGGAATAILGLKCHYTIALLWTLLFFALYPRVPILSRSRALTGAAYGVFVSVVMNLVVLPLSRVPSRPIRFGHFAVATLILMITIGPPLAWCAARYYGRSSETSGSAG